MTDQILDNLPLLLDQTNGDHLAMIDEKVNQLLSRYRSREALEAMEKELLSRKGPTPVFALLVLKIARSRLIIDSISEDATISLVLAVYKEHNRIRRNHEHPHGEDFLCRKISQLEKLFSGHPNFKWQLIIVDDGCPEGSGRIAQDIIKAENLQDRARVLFLKDAIERGIPTTRILSSVSDSQKGGSIIYGMWHATRQAVEGQHIVIYTDADLSTHLGQTGLLVEPILKQHKDVAIGSRREPQSVVVKKGSRNDRGKLFIYLWKRLIPILGDIIDTQCGFKAFRRETLLQIMDDLIEYRFAFDIELLLRATLQARDSIAKVPIAWIDSEEASTTTDLQPYLPMLRSIACMYRNYLPRDPEREEFASFISELDEDGFNELVAHIPQAIVERDPWEFSEFDGVTIKDLRRSLL